MIRNDGDEMPAESAYLDTYAEWGPRQSELNLRLIADAARDIGATPVFLTQARLPTRENRATAQERIRYDHVQLSHDALVRAFEDYDAAILRATKAEDVPLLDISDRFSGQQALFADHVHTTPAGSQAIAEAVAEFLTEVIDQRRP